MSQSLAVSLSDRPLVTVAPADTAVTGVALADAAVRTEHHDLGVETAALVAAMVPKPWWARRLQLDGVVAALFADPGFAAQADTLIDAMTERPSLARQALVNATVEDLLA